MFFSILKDVDPMIRLLFFEIKDQWRLSLDYRFGKKVGHMGEIGNFSIVRFYYIFWDYDWTMERKSECQNYWKKKTFMIEFSAPSNDRGSLCFG